MDLDNPLPPAPLADPCFVPFPVVGIGASAGGYQALSTLLQHMPPDPGMALVVILHLAADEPSAADKLLQRATAMPVVQVAHTMPILPGHVYVIPPDRSLTMCDGHLVLDRLDRSRARPVAIDIFLRTLAEAHREQAVGIVLSGMGSDGTAGLASIKQMGGVTIAQLPTDAQEGSMPRSAIESGAADFVLAASAMPHKLLELRDIAGTIRRRACEGRALDGVPLDVGPDPEAVLGEVLALLRARTGHDFTHYRRPTLLRRLERRLQVRGMPDLASYHGLLREDAGEAHALLKDFLIGVTGFYRDPAAFDALDRLVLPDLMAQAGEPLRAWVAACSTGEDAYSLAMLLAGQAARHDGDGRGWQVFASDIDGHAIAAARAGLYPTSIEEAVPAPLLERYFTQHADRYQVRKSLRDGVLFARHNLLQDPAFSRLDLISCRNFLIYLNRGTHRQLLQLFHFALKPGGCLMLGSTESVEAAAELFEPVDAARRIYRARPAAHAPGRAPQSDDAPADSVLAARTAVVPLPRAAARPAAALSGAAASPARRGRLFSFAEIHLHKAAGLAPASILLNEDGAVLHVSEAAARFLRPAGGEPTRELVELVLPPLQLPLRVALFQARQSGGEAGTGPLRYGQEGGHGDGQADGEADGEGRAPQAVAIEVLPFRDPHAEGLLLLVRFVDAEAAAPPAGEPSEREHAMLRQLDDELRHTRRQLQDTLEEAEAGAADMRIYGEEMQTTVEELRARADVLEHSRAELQADNRDLAAANRRLQQEAAQSAKAHDDMINLVASSGVATIFLDRGMCILRYTPRIADFFNVLPSDIGRPLLHITNRLDYPHLAEDAATVFDTLQAMEREVRSKDGRDYIVRVHPYRTTADRIEGAVMTFFDITGRRAAEVALRESEERFRLFLTAGSDVLYRMNADWSEMQSLHGKDFLADTANPSRTWLETYVPFDDRPQVQAAIDAAIAARAIFELEHRVIRSGGGIAWAFSRAIPLLDAGGAIVEWFGAVTDITRRKQDEEIRRDSEARLFTVFESLPVGVCVLGEDGRMLLSNRVMHRYLPNGVMPSRDPERGGRWRAWDADGRPLAARDFPGTRALRGERVLLGIEMLHRQDDGREIWTQVASAPVSDGAGRVSGEATVVITDIDALKRVEAMLREREGEGEGDDEGGGEIR